MKPTSENIEWQLYPETEKYITQALDKYFEAMPKVLNFKQELLTRTSTRLWDWIDYVEFNLSDPVREKMKQLGFQKDSKHSQKDEKVYVHPGTTFPRILLKKNSGSKEESIISVAIRVEDIPTFLASRGIRTEIKGSPLSPYREAEIWQQEGYKFLAVERRAYGGVTPEDVVKEYIHWYLKGYEKWLNRQRHFSDEKEGMKATLKLAKQMVKEYDQLNAVWLAFAAERKNWELKNKAGQIQKSRQDVLGLGWANHDHHTFRSSRTVFPILIEILETFGFELREKFYAGEEAGWGAQVLEQPTCGLVVFADVDLLPGELETDFAHKSFSDRKGKGTVGLWCALNGESMLQAGLHHLACRFDFDSLTSDLEDEKIFMLPPFSDFDYLKQAFSRGERWRVPENRLKKLRASDIIDEDQYNKLVKETTVGSHMENIQRSNGFKGFNQQSVSDIIKRTDPRMDIGAA